MIQGASHYASLANQRSVQLTKEIWESDRIKSDFSIALPNEISLLFWFPSKLNRGMIISQPGEAGDPTILIYFARRFHLVREILLLSNLREKRSEKTLPDYQAKKVCQGIFIFSKSYDYFSKDNACFLNSRSLTAFQK